MSEQLYFPHLFLCTTQTLQNITIKKKKRFSKTGILPSAATAFTVYTKTEAIR